MQRSIADRAEAPPSRLVGDVNNDMLPSDDRGDHHILLVFSPTPKGIAGERRQSVGVEREHDGSLRPPR